MPSTLSTPVSSMDDLPTDFLNKLLQRMSLKERTKMRKVSKKLRTLVDNVKFHMDTIDVKYVTIDEKTGVRMTLRPSSIIDSIKDNEEINIYYMKKLPFCEVSTTFLMGSWKKVKFHCIEALVVDLKLILKNRNLTIREFRIAMQNGNDLCQMTFLKRYILQYQINIKTKVENFHLSLSGSQQQFKAFLETLDSKSLKTLSLHQVGSDRGAFYVDEIATMKLWKSVNSYVNKENCVADGIENYLHFPKAEIRMWRFSYEDVIKIILSFAQHDKSELKIHADGIFTEMFRGIFGPTNNGVWISDIPNTGVQIKIRVEQEFIVFQGFEIPTLGEVSDLYVLPILRNLPLEEMLQNRRNRNRPANINAPDAQQAPSTAPNPHVDQSQNRQVVPESNPIELPNDGFMLRSGVFDNEWNPIQTLAYSNEMDMILIHVIRSKEGIPDEIKVKAKSGKKVVEIVYQESTEDDCLIASGNVWTLRALSCIDAAVKDLRVLLRNDKLKTIEFRYKSSYKMKPTSLFQKKFYQRFREIFADDFKIDVKMLLIDINSREQADFKSLIEIVKPGLNGLMLCASEKWKLQFKILLPLDEICEMEIFKRLNSFVNTYLTSLPIEKLLHIRKVEAIPEEITSAMLFKIVESFKDGDKLSFTTILYNDMEIDFQLFERMLGQRATWDGTKYIIRDAEIDARIDVCTEDNLLYIKRIKN